MPQISRRALLVCPIVGAMAGPARKSRAASFFGIHLDLHPNPADKELGKDVSAANVDRLLRVVKPDYVQYDCKGHAGWLGYPSKVSKSAPGIVVDSLQIWRERTDVAGVSLFAHFSGVWDSLAIAEHPEWARVKADGSKDDRQTSLWSAYAAARMIPQLLEVSERYKLDGVWVDGDCWQTQPDYSVAAIAGWRRFGMGLDAPRKPEDANWEVWLEYNRQRFRDYVREYTEKLHAARPGFQVASNWLYSTFVPEKPDVGVDFLSGDYLGNASISRARLDARYLGQTGKPWDLMAWGFQIADTKPASHIHKPAVQLQQEAGVVLAQGGGFQIYYQPSRAGRIDDRHIDTMGEVAQFCRERERLCHKSESLSEVAILFSRTSLYRRSNKLFGDWGKHIAACTGLLDALVGCHRSVDVAPDWGALNWPVLVIPEWEDIGDGLAREISDKVRKGMKLFLSGAANARKFASLMGWKLVGEAKEEPAWVEGDHLFGVASGLWQKVEPGGGKIVAQRFASYDSSRDAEAAAVRWEFGKGQVVLAPGPIGAAYDLTHSPALRQFVAKCMNELGAPQVSLKDRSAPVEVVLRRQRQQMVLHLLNHASQQVAANYPVMDFVPALGPQLVSLKMAVEPKRVMWEPEGKALGFEYENGRVVFEVPKVRLHELVVID
jgi:hypothetical protein